MATQSAVAALDPLSTEQTISPVCEHWERFACRADDLLEGHDDDQWMSALAACLALGHPDGLLERVSG